MVGKGEVLRAYFGRRWRSHSRSSRDHARRSRDHARRFWENGSAATAAIHHHQAVGSSIGLSPPKQRGLARKDNRL